MAVPRWTVTTSATGMSKKYTSAKRATIAAPPIHKTVFDSGNFNFGELVWYPLRLFAIRSCLGVAALVPGFSSIFETIIAKTLQPRYPFDQASGVDDSQLPNLSFF